MHRFNAYIPIDLFDRIKLLANFYKVPISKMMTQLLEIGYLKMLDQGGYDNEIND